MIPIDLTADEARAASEGRLTEIVRPVEPQPACECRYEMNANGDKALHLATSEAGALLFVPVRSDSADHRLPCPFGAPGALLYGREEWTQVFPEANGPVLYAADELEGAVVVRKGKGAVPWRSAERMPEWASRFRWRNGGVRVELRAGTWCWVVTLEVQ